MLFILLQNIPLNPGHSLHTALRELCCSWQDGSLGTAAAWCWGRLAGTWGLRFASCVVLGAIGPLSHLVSTRLAADPLPTVSIQLRLILWEVQWKL